ncbi:hypothetical protein PISMIDRAFT_682077 [Pisolithus microcarpus 441]|uniref:Uncharacterized protein n=1 Tax=Pisolithus microcarpus 441 TaxID=765257 RepID=A0A0C9Z381_9AGAM|nr:hypothetical protein PISMIDRAFT_682077 [Pisolithus microcarpus 441]
MSWPSGIHSPGTRRFQVLLRPTCHTTKAYISKILLNPTDSCWTVAFIQVTIGKTPDVQSRLELTNEVSFEM